MSLSSPFVRRPIGTLLLTIGLFLTGVAAYFMLPVAPLPEVDYPTIQVRAQLSGASPETMATSVTSPLERRLRTIAGVTEITSDSRLGQSSITLQFDLSRDVNGAAREVGAAISAARADLPATLRNNPTYWKVNPADAPVMILTLTSPTRAPAEIYDQVSNVVQQRLSQVPGVGEVELGGGSLPAVRIDLNPPALAQYGISLEDVRTAIGASGGFRPKGVIEGPRLAWQVEGSRAGRFAVDYRDIIVAWRDGIAVRLSDVARVYDGPENIRTLGLYNGKRAVTVVIRRQPGANIIATVDEVHRQLPGLRASLPADIRLDVASDRTRTIRASLHEVELTLVIATLLVVAVVSVFLRSLRATVVPFVAVVVSISGTLAGMHLLGFSLNNLSLMALTVATGFVVDDAIVVLENIMRHREEGSSRIQAALDGAREVGFTVLSISVSLVAVFIPLLFMAGIVGRLFREFAVTMTVAVAISLLISLTTTPVLASLVLPDADVEPGRFARAFERGFDRLKSTYGRSLDWALAHKPATMLLLVGAVAMNVFLFLNVPTGFFPEQDTGLVQGGMRADRSISFPAMSEKLGLLVDTVRADPAVESVVAFTGGRGGGGFMSVQLKPRGERVSAREAIDRLRPKLARISGIQLWLNPSQDMRIGGRGGNAAYQYTLQSDTVEGLEIAAPRMEAALKQETILEDVNLEDDGGASEVFIDVDRDAARRLGIDQRLIDAILYNGFGQRQVANIYSGLNQYRVVMGVDPAFALSPDALSQVYIPTALASAAGSSAGNGQGVDGQGADGEAANGAGSASATGSGTGTARNRALGAAISTDRRDMAPLSGFARWSVRASASEIEHEDGVPSTTISFALADGVSLSTASDRVREVEAEVGLPEGVRASFRGTAQAFSESTATMPLLILAAIVVIYIVLGILYESWVHPITVLSTLPSAGLGAVAALAVLGEPLDLIALIGLILLIGIVKKNAIMIIDFALEAERTRGLTPHQAIREAAMLRFRPILMTSLAAGLGALPLAIGFGDGAELRRPLGYTIIGGLIASQFITLLTTPVVYLLLDRFRRTRPAAAPTTTRTATA